LPAAPARRDAAAIGLRYVTPDQPGISRRPAGDGFEYVDPDGKPVRSEESLARIRSIAIPPAWTDVWISPYENGHIQATGRDARGRLQYRYHPAFRARRDTGKFARLIRFGERLPRIRRRVERDLARRGLPREKVLAAVVNLLETTRFRVGNVEYARLNQSFGISTLRTRHASVAGATIRFRFRGKGGRTEDRQLVDRRLAAVVRRCQDLPGQALFQYLDDDGEPRPISSEDVNEYVREAAGTDEFSAKDFRTWAATVLAHRALREAAAAALEAAAGHPAAAARKAAAARSAAIEAAEAGPAPAAPLPKRVVKAAIEQTAEAIGDTPTVTRNSYVHPAVLEAPVEASSRRRPLTGHPTREEELEVLRLLRREDAAARRSQVRRGRVAGRSSRAAA
jgi:DNA topoisomerase I